MPITNLTIPEISGSFKRGETLHTTDGTWDADVPFNIGYQWMRCDAVEETCTEILGATSSNYLLTASDIGARIRIKIRATESVAPSGSQLRWSPPSLSSPTIKNLTNASRSVPSGSGGDLTINNNEILTGGIGQITGYNDVVWIGGHINSMSGTPSGHVIPINNSGTLHFEGLKGTVGGDFWGARFTNPIIQIQACDILVSDLGTSAHADAFQTQFLTCDELRCDMGTIRTDYQGFFISNEPTMDGQPLPSQVGKFILSRWNFRPGPQGYPATFVFKAIPPRPTAQTLGPWEFYDVWMPNSNAVYKVYPSASWVAWNGTAHKYGCFMTTKRHPNGNTYPFVRFSTSADKVPIGPYAGQQAGDCGIGGEGGIWLHDPNGGPPDGDFAPGDAGINYTSPGYL